MCMENFNDKAVACPLVGVSLFNGIAIMRGSDLYVTCSSVCNWDSNHLIATSKVA